MAWRITEAGAKQAPEIADLTGLLLEEIMSATGHPHFDFDWEEARQRTAAYLDRGLYQVFLARPAAGDAPIGMITATETRALYADGTFGLVPEFFVHPDWRSRGAGRDLLEALSRRARELGWSRLELTTPPLPTFERTFAFYEGEGFTVAGGRKMKLDL